MLAAPDGTLYEGILYVRGRYPVGSGDAFLAGLVTALERGSDGKTRSAWPSGRAPRTPSSPAPPGSSRRAPSRSPPRRTCTSSSRMRVEPFVEDDWAAFREIRLRSLLDSPDVFGSTYGEESSHAEPAWRDWAAGRWRGGTALAFAVRDRGRCGRGNRHGRRVRGRAGRRSPLRDVGGARRPRGGHRARARRRRRRLGACARMQPAGPLGHRDERRRTPFLRSVRVRRHR